MLCYKVLLLSYIVVPETGCTCSSINKEHSNTRNETPIGAQCNAKLHCGEHPLINSPYSPLAILESRTNGGGLTRFIRNVF